MRGSLQVRSNGTPCRCIGDETPADGDVAAMRGDRRTTSENTAAAGASSAETLKERGSPALGCVAVRKDRPGGASLDGDCSATAQAALAADTADEHA
mmetsp:Transcript_18301/g.55220  ORF Transcript_18301/g.55220 Transcript_18301/m.55220 type:complete len:97 (+) Transcript_18301:1217-1507(+)|eukprot:scaffold229248_cov35-Tisochrysis_lutea.AAC.5